MQYRQPPGRAHRGAQCFGRKRCGAPRSQQDQVVPKGRGAAQQGAHIAGILHAFQRQDVGSGVQPLYRGRGLFKQHKHALARLGARQLFGHVRRDQRGAQAFQSGRLFHSRLGGISRARGAAFGQFQAKLRPLGKKQPLRRALLLTIAQCAGILYACVVAAGDYIHCSAPLP